MILSEVEFRKGCLVLNIKKKWKKLFKDLHSRGFFYWKSSRKFRPKRPRPVCDILAAFIYLETLSLNFLIFKMDWEYLTDMPWRVIMWTKWVDVQWLHLYCTDHATPIGLNTVSSMEKKYITFCMTLILADIGEFFE